MPTATTQSEVPLRPLRPLREAGDELKRVLWRQAFAQRSVRLRALKLGFTTGLLQAAVNQGDRWLGHTVDQTVILKTIVSPLIGFMLVLFSAAATWVERSVEHSKL